MSEDAVQLTIRGPVATLTLNRPHVLNALDRSLGEGLVAAVEACRDDPAVRAVLITGAGRGFCAGGDLKAAWAHVQAGGALPDYFESILGLLHHAILTLARLDKPVIAALHGPTSGAGLSLAAACDLRIAAAGATIKQAYTTIGLTPDGGWTALVPPLIGAARAMELCLLDPVLDAATAQRIGLVSEVVADDALLDRTREIAARLAAGPTTAFAGAKRLIRASAYVDLPAQLDRERAHILAQAATQDFLAGVQGFITQTPPTFPGV